MEKEKENVEVNHDQEEEEEVTPKTKTTKKKKKKIMSEEHEINEQKNHEQEEEGVTKNTKTPAKKKKKKKLIGEEHEISEQANHEQKEGVTKNTKTTPTKKKKKSEEHESSEQKKNDEQEEGVTKNTKKTPTKKKNKSEEHESSEQKKNYEQEEGITKDTKTPTKKKKKSEEYESSDLNSHSLVLALPATPKNVAVKKKKNKIGNAVEEGSVSEKKKRTKNKKKGSENVEDRKIELDEDLVKPETDSKMNESSKEMGLEGKKISRKKKKKRDENEMEVVADGNDEAGSEHTKIERRKKKRCISSVIVDMEEKALEEAMRELMVKVKKPASVVQTEENDMEVDTEMKKRKKKKMHGSSECTKIMDAKPLEDILQDLSVEEKPEAVQQAVENHEEVNMEQEVMKKQLSSSENGDGNQSNTPGIALLTSENHEQISASKKKKTSRKKKLIAQNMLKEGSQELQLPVESGLKGSLLADENHVSRIKDKSTVCKVKASNDASAHDLSIKQPVEKSGVSSSELLKEVKTTELDLPKSAPMGALCPHVGTRRKLLILDLNGLLLDIVMVVPRGYKAEKRIGQKSVFKRPFCDDFLKFCFERFEVGVWTSRTKRNMDDVIGFLMPNTKHKLLFCWDQSHCTMTGINTIDNRHKPLVCKELSKLWDKLEPSLPWEKGEYNESNTLLLDDSPYKALLNPPNTAIFPSSYSLVDKNDNSLGPEGDIRLYLEGVAAAEDVQKYVKQHPFGQPAITDTSSSWGFYCRVFDQFKRQLD